MKLLQGKPRPNVERSFAVHDDGTVSFGLVARRVAARRSAKGDYLVLDLEEVLPLAVQCEELEMNPRLVVKLYCRPSAGQRERRQCGVIRRWKR